jgi:hypothetical protein
MNKTAARYAARIAFMLSIMLTVAVGPWSLVIATGPIGQKLNFSDVPTLLIGAAVFLSTWVSFMAVYLTSRKA